MGVKRTYRRTWRNPPDLHIEGMSCGHCLNAVSKALHTVSGVTVKSVQIGRAEVEVSDPAVAAAMNNAIKPDFSGTVFAGQDREATERARQYFTGYAPSSPSWSR